MSYNIDNIEHLTTGRLLIAAGVRSALAVKHADDTPEDTFLTDDSAVRESRDLPGYFVIERIGWYGEGSGRSDGVLVEVLSETLGAADLMLTWEGGDHHSGYRVINGKVTEMGVGFTLIEKKRSS